MVYTREIGGFVDFWVMDEEAAYNALLGHPWMQKNAIISSNLSPMRQILSTGQGTIPAGNDPFLKYEAYHAGAHFDRVKDNQEKGRRRLKLGVP